MLPPPADNKAEWGRMIMTLAQKYDPLNSPDFSMVMMDIFYTVLGLESYYKILSKNHLVHIVEELL